MIDLTAKSGDWRWAGAMAYAGHQVRRVDFARGMSIGLSDGKWRYRSGNYASTIGEIAEDREYDWELWQGPPPVEPERVRWTITRRLGGSYTTLPPAYRDIPVWKLPVYDERGYRFGTFIGHHNGKEIHMGALPVVYVKPTWDGDRLTPDNAHTIPLYPDEVEMVKVGGGK